MDFLKKDTHQVAKARGRGNVRLCLCGEVERATVQLLPDEIHFAELRVGETLKRVINVKNPGNLAAVKFTVSAINGVSCTPRECLLQPNRSVDVLVNFQGRINS